MKTKFYFRFIFVFALAFSAPIVNAQTLIQYWDFNRSRPLGGAGGDSLGTDSSYVHTIANDTARGTWPLFANQVVGGLSTGFIKYIRPQAMYNATTKDGILDAGSQGSAIYDHTNTNDTTSLAAQNQFVRTRNPSDSAEMYIYIPTKGYKNIMFDFALSASSTKGPNFGVFSYSVDSGATWKKLTTTMDTFNISGVKRPDTLQLQNPTTAASSWYPVQMNFTSDASVNNTNKFVIKMMLAGVNSHVQTSGNARFDNFSFWGTSTSTDVDNVSSQDAGYKVYPNPTGNFVNVISHYIGDKIITIYNIEGQAVSVTKSQGIQTMINMSSLNAGIYFVEIKEANGNNKYTEKVVKQ